MKAIRWTYSAPADISKAEREFLKLRRNPEEWQAWTTEVNRAWWLVNMVRVPNPHGPGMIWRRRKPSDPPASP